MTFRTLLSEMRRLAGMRTLVEFRPGGDGEDPTPSWEQMNKYLDSLSKKFGEPIKSGRGLLWVIPFKVMNTTVDPDGKRYTTFVRTKEFFPDADYAETLIPHELVYDEKGFVVSLEPLIGGRGLGVRLDPL